MKGKDVKFLKWAVYILVAILLLVLLTNYLERKSYYHRVMMEDDVSEINPMIIEMCAGQQRLCENEVRVYKEIRNCYDEYDACLIR